MRRANDVRRGASWVQRCARTGPADSVQTRVSPSGGPEAGAATRRWAPRPRKFAQRCHGRASHRAGPPVSWSRLGTLSTSLPLSCGSLCPQDGTGGLRKTLSETISGFRARYISRQPPVVASCSQVTTLISATTDRAVPAPGGSAIREQERRRQL